MRRLSIVACIALAPALALAEPQITGVALESTEPEVRVVVSLDPPAPAPAHRLMRDDNSLRLRFVDTVTQGLDEQFEDETLRRVRVVSYRGRVIVRMDPRRSTAVDLLERAEVQPHPHGVVIVLQRSDREIARYREAHAPLQIAARDGQETASEETREDMTGEEDEAPQPAATGADESQVTSAAASSPRETTRGTTSTTTTSRRESARGQSSTQGAATMSSDPLRAGVAVAFVMILGGIAWYMRRRRGRSGGAGSLRSIDVVAAKRIGPRQSLLLVEAGGQTLLVGTTEKGMVRLATLGDREGREIDDDVQVDADEELALPRLKKPERRGPTPLERELRRPMTMEKLSFEQELESEGVRLSGWSKLLASRAARRPDRKIEAPPTTSTDAIEGLLKLRQMSDGSTSMAPRANGTNGRINGHINGSRSNGTDMSIAALESLLTTRQAN